MDTLLQIGLSNALAATALALLAAASRWCCRRPALVHSLWLLVLLKLVTPPLRMMPILPPGEADPPAPAIREPAPPTAGRPQAPAEPVEAGSALDRLEVPAAEDEMPPDLPTGASQPAPAAVGRDGSWKLLLVAGWLGSAALWLLVVGVRIGRFRRLLRYARPAPEGLRRQAEQLAGRLGIRHCPGVWLVPGPVSPMLWALGGRPRLLLPAALWQRLGEDQRTTLLAHELAHYRRRDHWVRGLELLATSLYWWHPIVWWGRHELRQAEEECCDAWVVWALPQAARAYATALLETVIFLADGRTALPPAVSGAGHVHVLKRRLTMIMAATTPRALSWAGCIGVLGLGTILLPWLPTQAKSEPPDAVEKADPAWPKSAAPAERVQKRALLMEQACAKCHAQPAGHIDPVVPGHDEVIRLMQQVEEQRQLVRQAEAKLKQAQGRLADTERRLRQALERFEQAERPRNDRPKEKEPNDQRRIQELEKKLDDLRREMDELRRHETRRRLLPPQPMPAVSSGQYEVIPGASAVPIAPGGGG